MWFEVINVNAQSHHWAILLRSVLSSLPILLALVGPPGPIQHSGGGVSFTRWGKTTCPSTGGTQLLYAGAMAGSAWHSSGSSEYLCLHQQPEFLRTTPGLQAGRGRLHGVEYEARDSAPAFSNIEHHDAPCTVCYTPTRNTKITIPGRISCPPSWTREYYGYLMASGQYPNQASGRVPACIDVNPESVPGSAGHANQPGELYFLETTCIGIRCPPYSNGVEITCAVCTK